MNLSIYLLQSELNAVYVILSVSRLVAAVLAPGVRNIAGLPLQSGV